MSKLLTYNAHLTKHMRRLREMVLEHQHLYFVFEFVASNVAEVTERRKRARQGPFAIQQVQQCAFQLLDGLAYMHKMGFFHRDIKPDNLLCEVDGSNIKIADFGLAAPTRRPPPYTEYVSTRWYRAPEVILGDPAYSSPVDLWACGCIMAEMALLSPLLPGTSTGDQMSRIVNLVGAVSDKTWPEGVRLASTCRMQIPRTKPTSLDQVPGIASSPDAMRSLIAALLTLDPSKRPSSTQALKHTFFQGYNDDAVQPSLMASDAAPAGVPYFSSLSTAVPPPLHAPTSSTVASFNSEISSVAPCTTVPKVPVALSSNHSDGEPPVDLAEDIDALLDDFGFDKRPNGSPVRGAVRSAQHNLPPGSLGLEQVSLSSGGGVAGVFSSGSSNTGSVALGSLSSNKKSSLDNLLEDVDSLFESPNPVTSSGRSTGVVGAFGSRDGTSASASR